MLIIPDKTKYWKLNIPMQQNCLQAINNKKNNNKPDNLKIVFFLCNQNFCFEILRKKKSKNITKNQLICVKHDEKL